MKVVTFGEIMLRLMPQNNLRFMQEKSFEATFGGAEANVAVCLSNFGICSEFVTKLPNNDIAKACISELNSFGVCTKNVAFGGDRMGLYYIEKGVGNRASKIIYDRKHSSMSEADISDFDIENILKDATLLQFTGITPALSPKMAEITKQIVKVAKDKNILVACDLNYRQNLWNEKQAGKVMSEILPYVDIVFGLGKYEAEKLFGIYLSNDDIDNSFEALAKKLVDKFGFKIVATTIRQSESATKNKLSGKIFDGEKVYSSKTYDLEIVDRVGGGDAFTAGVIFGLLNNYDKQKIVDFATISSVLKHTIQGDFNRVSKNEVLAVLQGNDGGRVLR